MAQTDPARVEMIEKAAALVPVLRERAKRVERDRRMSDDTHRDFLDAGFYRIHQPARYGGREWDLSMMVEIAAQLGRGCGSSAWVFTNLAVKGWVLGMQYPEVQDEVWGDNPLALCASSFPSKGGTARRADGGIVCDGLWSFASGVDFADWNHMQVMVPQESGPPIPAFALVPKSDYEIVDDWQAAGLAGTGSRSIRLDDVFVPERRILPTELMKSGEKRGSAVNPSPLYRLPVLTLGTKIFSGPALGIATGALEAIDAEVRGRANVAGMAMHELPTIQARIAEADAEIAAARALLLSDCADALARAAAGEDADLDQRARWRLNNAFAGQLCLRAVERLHPIVGARGLDPDSPFMRAWRDIHAVVLQITMAWDIQAINAGRTRFGLPAMDPRV